MEGSTPLNKSLTQLLMVGIAFRQYGEISLFLKYQSGQIISGPLGDIESAEPQAINNRIATTSEDPNSPESSESITLNLSVDDKGPATHQGDLQDDARSYHHLNKKHNSVQQRYKCCHCGALFRFDFSYEAHMRQHNMMDT